MRPIAGIEPMARAVFRELDDRILQLEARVALTHTVGSLSGSGGVRAGSPANRGDAIDHHPEVYIQIDRSTNKVTFFVTSPTDTAGGSFDWVEWGSVTLT